MLLFLTGFFVGMVLTFVFMSMLYKSGDGQ